MSDTHNERRTKRINVWLAIGVVVAIVLLIIWLTIADLWGDTDVNYIALL